MQNKKDEKIGITLRFDVETLALIDEYAQKEQRSRSNFLIFSALSYIESKKKETPLENG